MPWYDVYNYYYDGMVPVVDYDAYGNPVYPPYYPNYYPY